jgi:large conductance mechanosensitive channel
MSLAKEFKEFIARGNVIDLAVGVIIGAAFGKIVNSLVTDIIMPPIGRLTGSLKSVSDLYIAVDGKTYPSLDEARKAGVAFAYGNFCDLIIQFLIVAFAVFLLVKIVNRLKREQAEAPTPPAPPPRSEVLLEEIRDALKSK